MVFGYTTVQVKFNFNFNYDNITLPHYRLLEIGIYTIYYLSLHN